MHAYCILIKLAQKNATRNSEKNPAVKRNFWLHAMCAYTK